MPTWRKRLQKVRKTSLLTLVILGLVACGNEEDSSELVDYSNDISESESEESIDIYGSLAVNPDNLDTKHFLSVNEQQWLTIDKPYFEGLVAELLTYDNDVLNLVTTYDSRTIGYDFATSTQPSKDLLVRLLGIQESFNSHIEPYTYYSKEQQAYYTNLINELTSSIDDRVIALSSMVATVDVESSDSVDIRDYDKRMKQLSDVSTGKDSIAKVTTLYSTAIKESLQRERDEEIKKETDSKKLKKLKKLVDLSLTTEELNAILYPVPTETTESVESLESVDETAVTSTE